MKKSWVWIILTLLWCIGIYAATEMPAFTGENTEKFIERKINSQPKINESGGHASLESNNINLVVRKSTHVIAFGILALLIWKSLMPHKGSYIIAWVLATLYAISDEWHQVFIPERSGTVRDVVIDSFGAGIFLVFIYFWQWKKGKHV